MSVQVENLCFSYGQRQVLCGVSFEANYGHLLSVLGPNGAGKSTLFRCMLGILQPSAGQTLVDGLPTAGLGPGQLARLIAYIPQSHNPVFNYSVLDMVLMGTTAQLGRFSSPGSTQVELAQSALERMGILHLKDRGYLSISGGERQLTLIARAIAQQARVLLMDEPSASLDFGNRTRLMQTLRSLAQSGYAIIQSTHDPEQAYRYSSRVLALHAGRVLAMGPPEEALSAGLISRLYGVPVESVGLKGGAAMAFLPIEKEAEDAR